MEKLGATGKFPQGKLNNQDEGEIKMAILIEKEKLIIVFGKPVEWLGLDKEDVATLIEVLTKKYNEM